MRRLVGLAVVGALVGGCQGSPPTTPAAPAATLGSRTAQLKADGDALAARGDYQAAVVKYQAALHDEPGNVGIRFSLGSVLSHLGRRQETVEHFRQVVSRGDPRSSEVRQAREWLLAASALDAAVPGVREESASTPDKMAPTMSETTGRVHGKLLWPNVNPLERRALVRITLTGDDIANRDVSRSRPDFKLGRSWEFNNLPPGTYSLVAESAGTRMWEQRVRVEPNQATVLDLTDGNTVAPRDFSPPNES